jgi:hypothetical protein
MENADSRPFQFLKNKNMERVMRLRPRLARLSLREYLFMHSGMNAYTTFARLWSLQLIRMEAILPYLWQQ